MFDELDRLAADPTLIPPPLPEWGIVHTFARAEGQALRVVALHLLRDDARQILTMTGVQLVADG